MSADAGRCPACGTPLETFAAILCGRRSSGGRGCEPVRTRCCPNPECRAVEAEPGAFFGMDGKRITAQQTLEL